MRSDIEIAQACPMQHIRDIAREAGIAEEYLEQYGNYKAKIDTKFFQDHQGPDGKLILVTAITPTPAGEGKTTTTVGLADGLRKIGKKSVVALREPSLGPVFGLKGGAAGAMTALLKDALKPNLVQTLEGTPALIHGGPFANIAHGCNSIMATTAALKLGD